MNEFDDSYLDKNVKEYLSVKLFSQSFNQLSNQCKLQRLLDLIYGKKNVKVFFHKNQNNENKIYSDMGIYSDISLNDNIKFLFGDKNSDNSIFIGEFNDNKEKKNGLYFDFDKQCIYIYGDGEDIISINIKINKPIGNVFLDFIDGNKDIKNKIIKIFKNIKEENLLDEFYTYEELDNIYEEQQKVKKEQEIEKNKINQKKLTNESFKNIAKKLNNKLNTNKIKIVNNSINKQNNKSNDKNNIKKHTIMNKNDKSKLSNINENKYKILSKKNGNNYNNNNILKNNNKNNKTKTKISMFNNKKSEKNLIQKINKNNKPINLQYEFINRYKIMDNEGKKVKDLKTLIMKS